MPQNRKKLNTLLVLLLAVQILCTAVFPLAVRRMTDIGIRQSGLKSAVPVALREQTMEDLRLFMAPGDYKAVHDAYTIENGVCTLSDCADSDTLSSIFAPAIRLYLRTVQCGGNTMAAARAAMENGTMTQSQLFDQAREGLTELTEAQEITASTAFLRAEYSVLGMNPDGIRTSYLQRITFALMGCAVVVFAAAMLSAHLRRKNGNPPVPEKAASLAAAGISSAIAIWGLIEWSIDTAKPGAFTQTALALTQAAMILLPAALGKRSNEIAPRDQGERIRSALPAALGAVSVILALSGTCAALRSADTVSAGLNRVIAGSGTTDRAALLGSLLPGSLMIVFGVLLLLTAVKLDKARKFAFPNRLGSVLEILPGSAAMIAALVLVFSRRGSLAIILLIALAAGIMLMAWVQNRRPNRVAGLVRFPGQLACAAIAGLGADLAAKSILTISDYLLCVVCALIFTRTAAKLLTR